MKYYNMYGFPLLERKEVNNMEKGFFITEKQYNAMISNYDKALNELETTKKELESVYQELKSIKDGV